MVNWSDIEKINEVIETSINKTDVLLKLGLSNYGGNYNSLTTFINNNNIDITHFIDYKPNVNRKASTFFINALVENSSYTSSYKLKHQLYKYNIKKPICESCGQNENWLGKKMSLILDHINGIRNDNRIENLQILCPNCNATLLTHCRGYKGLLPKQSKKIKHTKKYNKKCSNSECNTMIKNESQTCRKHKKTADTKINKIDFENLSSNIKMHGVKKSAIIYNVSETTIRTWYKTLVFKYGNEDIIGFLNKKINYKPSYETLIKDVEKLGFSGCGRKYGVSDNAIRKWIKKYEKS